MPKIFLNFLLNLSLQYWGKLSKSHTYNLETLQRNSWIKQISILKGNLQNYPNGRIYFEFSIPRMGKRVDNILIINDLIFVVEFKVGDKNYSKHAVDQVIDYALDLKNFHEGSQNQKLIPILLSTNAEEKKNLIQIYEDFVYKPVYANSRNLDRLIKFLLSESKGDSFDLLKWENSIYKPTPTIIEAAQALYKSHNVLDISRSDAGAINLSKTSECVNRIIEETKATNSKTICFITGVPGSGKTLAGLNIANERKIISKDENAVFLSGNGPLVKVLREALSRDSILAAKEEGIKLLKKDAKREVNSFIQNIHHFRDDALQTKKPPNERVVIFDEAQRAWNANQAGKFMRQKRGISEFNKSEPEFLIDVMNRHEDWCVIVCLIGGGQEINTGEAGLEEWINSLKKLSHQWNVFFSERIPENSEYFISLSGKQWLIEFGESKPELHLGVSLRSFRSEILSKFVHQVLSLNIEVAKDLFQEIKNDYPIVITRDLEKAKDWVKNKARGTERYGLIASSNARRLRPFGVDVKNSIEVEHWFLDFKDDVRSSYYLEEVATEFDIQGLELDWVCVCWGADFYNNKGKWEYKKFKGSTWQNVNQEIQQRYLLNTYRVLLTRARQGIVIFLPKGTVEDETCKKSFYDGTFNYLTNIIGIDCID